MINYQESTEYCWPPPACSMPGPWRDRCRRFSPWSRSSREKSFKIIYVLKLKSKSQPILDLLKRKQKTADSQASDNLDRIFICQQVEKSTISTKNYLYYYYCRCYVSQTFPFLNYFPVLKSSWSCRSTRWRPPPGSSSWPCSASPTSAPRTSSLSSTTSGSPLGSP